VSSVDGIDCMKVAYLVNQYPKVSHTFIRREINALEASGFEVYRFSVRGWSDELRDPIDIEERKKTSYLLKQSPIALILSIFFAFLSNPIAFAGALSVTWAFFRRSHRSALAHAAYFVEACWLKKELREQNVQHLHAHFGTNSAAVATLCRCLGGPKFSFTIHGPEEFDQPYALNLNLKVAQCAFVAVISSFGRSQLLRWIEPVDRKKIVIVRCGLEHSYFAHQVADIKVSNNLLCVGRLDEQKGHLILLQAANELKKRGARFSITLAGDGPLRREIESLITSFGLENYVEITGWVDSETIHLLILNSRALVLPSFAEGLPVAIMEAMALRRPIISSFVAGIPELVQDQFNGWLVPAGNVEKLVGAMQECLNLSLLELTGLGNRAFDSVYPMHDVNQSAKQLAACFSCATAKVD
jgi:colanic acid/amylovoran biosynthesis glycosyltransferase